ncbi:MAG: Glu-tRNA(Gln) amidotransferase subunit GatD [Candidatus Nanoarchaeia archaeon]
MAVEKSFDVGDKVIVKTKDQIYEGLVMPSLEKAKDYLILKLKSGYNLGIKLGPDVVIKKVSEAEKVEKLGIKPPINPKLPSISIIATGGTITSKVDYVTGAVEPLIKPEELLLATPELLDIVNIKRLLSPFSIWSEDMTWVEWQKIANYVAEELNKEDVIGVLVTHGTDTLHYTAAALSFMLKNLNKPVALVGGQRSSDRGSFDGAQNLICAGHYLKSNISEVAIVMHATSEDDFCFAIRGTNVRKMHTSRRDTFRPINELPLAKIWPSGKFEILNKNYKTRNEIKNEKVIADTKFEPKIALLKYFPGADPEILNFFVEKKYKGIIVEATGLGHVSTNPKQPKNWLAAIKSAIEAGLFIGFVPQCIYGRLDPYVYSSGRMLLDAGVTYLGNMLAETAFVKLGWVLGHTKNIDEIKTQMTTNIAGELLDRISPQSFLY